MRRLKKAELAEAVALLEAGAETPELLAQDLFRLFESHAAQRTWYYGAFIYATIPGVVGPYSTRLQAEKALELLGPPRAWVVPGWTDEGWKAHMAEVDAVPEARPISAKESDRMAKGFWQRVFQIKSHEGAPGIIAESVKITKVPK